MSVRRKPESADSLELLLDTICNAFGGILFLTILLTILLRLSHTKSDSKAVSEPAREELTAVAAELDSVLAELETLEKTFAVQSKTRERLVDAELEQRHQELEQLQGQRKAVEGMILERSREAGQVQQKIDAIATASAELDRNLDRAKENHDQAKQKLDEERKRRTQSVVPAHSRTSRKLEMGLIVRYGRLYQERHLNPRSLALEPNFDDFVVMGEEEGFLRLTPKPYKGLAIKDNPEFAQGLSSILSQHPPSEWHACTVVWEDSFDTFVVLKKLLVGLGYEIRLLALADGGVTFEGHVRDPQVQ